MDPLSGLYRAVLGISILIFCAAIFGISSTDERYFNVQ